MSSTRMDRYVPVIRRFAAHTVLLHSVIAEALGLHVTDLRALWLLGQQPRTAGQLADELGLTSAAITALVDRLERNGYAVRQRNNKDRRKVTIQANPERLREIDSHYQSQHKAMTDVLDAYSDTEFTAIIDFLARTADVLAEQARRAQDNHAPEPGPLPPVPPDQRLIPTSTTQLMMSPAALATAMAAASQHRPPRSSGSTVRYKPGVILRL